MRTLLTALALAAVVFAGCKSQYWVWAEKDEPTIAANNAPPADPEPQATREIIFVLGIDGMD